MVCANSDTLGTVDAEFFNDSSLALMDPDRFSGAVLDAVGTAFTEVFLQQHRVLFQETSLLLAPTNTQWP